MAALNLAAEAQLGIAALRAGDAKSARAHFEAIVAAGQADTSVWHALAVACQRLGDIPTMLEAADKVLAAQPYHVPCLMLKGDHYANLGDDRAALSYYALVISVAAQMEPKPPEIAAAEQRALAMRDKFSAKMRAHLGEALVAAGYRRGQSSDRFSHAVDLLTGLKRHYPQQPRSFYFPELPNRQFYTREESPWLDAVEAAADDIYAELQAVIGAEQDFVPYIQADPSRPNDDPMKLMGKKDWSAFFLWKDGEEVPENARRCPKTMAAVLQAPLTRIKGRAPSILFSRLLPGARIPPHHGFINARLISHLPLIVPPGCVFRVGNDERMWEKSKAWSFDDTIEHEAANPSSETRIILIFEVWRPELTDEERALVTSLIEAVDTYQGDSRTRWDD